MKRSLYIILGTLLVLPLTVSSAFGLTLRDFRDQVFRPANLPAGNTENVSAENKVVQILNFLTNLLLYASGSIAVLMLVYGGIRLVTAAGNTEQKDEATKIIKWSAIGLFVVILAYALVTNLISLIFQATT